MWRFHRRASLAARITEQRGISRIEAPPNQPMKLAVAFGARSSSAKR